MGTCVPAGLAACHLPPRPSPTAVTMLLCTSAAKASAAAATAGTCPRQPARGRVPGAPAGLWRCALALLARLADPPTATGGLSSPPPTLAQTPAAQPRPQRASRCAYSPLVSASVTRRLVLEHLQCPPSPVAVPGILPAPSPAYFQTGKASPSPLYFRRWLLSTSTWLPTAPAATKKASSSKDKKVTPTAAKKSSFAKGPRDVAFIEGVRTPFMKSGTEYVRAPRPFVLPFCTVAHPQSSGCS